MIARCPDRAALGRVYFVGAGPGARELLTLKAHALLRRADVVLHDDLVPLEIVALAAGNAQVVNVGKRCGQKKITQAQINELVIEAARAGKEVVRLKSGDPGIFGRLAEEIEALQAADIPFEIVPGVTAGAAAAASIGASLTDRRKSSRLVMVSRHRAQQNGRVAARDWSGLACADTTLVIYMPGQDFSGLRRELLEAGFPSGLPVLLVSRASLPDQREWTTTLADLDESTPLEPPSILLLGRSLDQIAAPCSSLVAPLAKNDQGRALSSPLRNNPPAARATI